MVSPHEGHGIGCPPEAIDLLVRVTNENLGAGGLGHEVDDGRGEVLGLVDQQDVPSLLLGKVGRRELVQLEVA